MSEDREVQVDFEKLLTLARNLAVLGIDAYALLSTALKAERRFAETDEPLHVQIERNDPARMLDILEAPTFRRRLRELRVLSRTLGAGPDCYVIRPEDDTPEVHEGPGIDADRLRDALKELRAIGRALVVLGPEPPRRRRDRFEEMYLLRRKDHSAVLDDKGLPVIVPLHDALDRRATAQPVWAVERSCSAFLALLRIAKRETKGLRTKTSILDALNRGGNTPPSFRSKLAAVLAEQRRRFPTMRAESVAVCWAYGVALDPLTAQWLRRRKADRTKKRRVRGGHTR